MGKLEVKTLPVGQLRSNCYLVVNQQNKKLAVVDSGDDADFIQAEIAKTGLVAEKIVLTHGHFDHLLASLELKLAYNVPVAMAKEDEFLLKYAGESAERFTGSSSPIVQKPDAHLTDCIALAAVDFRVIKTPGHTPGSVCLYAKSEQVVFVGDLVFAHGNVGRYDFSYSSKDQLYKSIKHILTLPEETLVYPGHGEVTTIGELRGYWKG